MSTLQFILVISGTILIATFAGFALGKESKRVHGAIQAFKARAKAATTKGELTQLQEELNTYLNENCWHRAYQNHANEVLAFIAGRLT